MRVYRFSVIIEKDADGYYAFCPDLQGCYTQGDTYEAALENVKDAIRLHLEDRLSPHSGRIFRSDRGGPSGRGVNLPG